MLKDGSNSSKEPGGMLSCDNPKVLHRVLVVGLLLSGMYLLHGVTIL